MLSDGLMALDPGHYIEILFVEKIAALLAKWKAEKSWPIEILPSKVSTNPFHLI